MSRETSQEFQSFEADESQETRRIREEQASKKRKDDIEFLKNRKCFKDLIEGREDVFKDCEQFMKNYIFGNVALGSPITADFIAGYKLALEMFTAIPELYDVKARELGGIE